ncbi:MAG: Uma2 family endonuclease [Chloroflexota bacterium]|nr:Uma2 family endonuclease [Chloroflexota bacterium]MDE2959676.1 Uma2 family endonuclease [Chloroflexota bacterium]
MATPKTPADIPMLPYRRGGEIDYASLEFDPNEKNVTLDAMEQNLELAEILGLFRARFTDFNQRPDVFLDNETFICYDPSNLNVRIAPDVYLAFGVDAAAIRPRKIYLPWEVGKPPDWAMEIASESTASADVNRKPAIYAAIGVREFWHFDPTGGRYYGQPIWGGELADGSYREFPQTREPDGILKVYSPLLGISLCWDDGWPRVYDPATQAYDRNWRAVQAYAVAVRDQRDAAREERDTAIAEVERLRELLRRRNGEENEIEGDAAPC